MTRDGATSIWKLPSLSGILLFLAYYSHTLLPNFILFLPLLLWLDLEPGASRLRRLWAGFVFGMVAHIPSLHFHYYMAEYSWLAWPLYLGTAMALALKISLSIALLGWLRSATRWSYGVLLPLSWLPLEWAATWGDLRMTIDHVGHSLSAFPFLVQFADLLGTYGVGAFLLMVNGLIYEAVYGFYAIDRRRAVMALSILVAAVLLYDAWAWNRARQDLEHADMIRVAAVQPNVPLLTKREEGTYADQWLALDRLTREAARQDVDLIIWPETARPLPFVHRLDNPLSYGMGDAQSLARELGVSLVVGAEYYRIQDDEHYDVYNAAFLVHPDGTLDPAWGAKVYLVPFTEAVPFETILGPLIEGRGGQWRWMAGGFTPGPSNALLPVGEVQVGVLVCFEELFWDLGSSLRNAGAGLQLVITNDAWFGWSPFQSYLTDALRLRAIENRTSYARVANTGYSGFVDPLGRYSSRTGLFVEAVAVGEVAVTSRRTVYNRIGDVVAWLAIAGLGLFTVIAVQVERKRRLGH